jgi:type II secretory pathway predicted ATPase ExeA
MPKMSYERYGLSGNPFRDLSSESLEDVDVFHVNQNVDDELIIFKEELFDKENKAVIAVLGGNGSGKTQRLRFTQSEAKKNNAFCVYMDIAPQTQFAVASILEGMLENANLSGIQKTVNTPKWYRETSKYLKQVRKCNFNPDEIGGFIVNTLNEKAPSCLLMNDLHNLTSPDDLEKFIRVLQVICDRINPGVLVMISSDINYFQNLMNRYPNLYQRINRQMIIPPLNDQEASLMVAKRLLDKRFVGEIDPIYPFEDEAIYLMNRVSKGNPRQLLRIASSVVDAAVQRRAMVISLEIVTEILNAGSNQQLEIENVEKKPSVSTVQKAKDKKERFSFRKKEKTPAISNRPIPSGNPNPMNATIKNQITMNNPIVPQTKVVNNPDNGNPNPRLAEEFYRKKVKCPKCAKIFVFESTKQKDKLRCPNIDCDFVGEIKFKQ